MKPLTRKTVLVVPLILVLMGPPTQALSESDWSAHVTESRKALAARNLPLARSKLLLVFADINSWGTKGPPRKDLEPAVDGFFYSEGPNFTKDLRELAEAFEAAKQSADAERLFRKALALDEAYFGETSNMVIYEAMPRLIWFLERRSGNRNRDALAARDRLARAAERRAILTGKLPDRDLSLKERAVFFQNGGRFHESEQCWKRRVELYKPVPLDKQKLAAMKAANIRSMRNDGTLAQIPEMAGALDDLADFYTGRYQYDKVVKTREEAHKIWIAVLPDSWFLTHHWRVLATAYETTKSYNKQADALSQVIRLQEMARTDSGTLENSYQEYGAVLLLAGRKAESAAALAKSLRLKKSRIK